MIDRLTQAWTGFLDLHAATEIRPHVAPAPPVVWAEDEVQILVACLLTGTPGGSLRVHPEVHALEGFGPVDLIVTGPGSPTSKSPSYLLTRESPAALAVDVRVVTSPRGRAKASESASKLQMILRAGLTREAALCVLDTAAPADRHFYEKLEASCEITVLLALDGEPAARQGGARAGPSAGHEAEA